jgi:hypothetical protein
MLTLPRALVWVGAMALVIFVFVIYSSVRILKTTVQGHTATLDKPVLETAIFPGVPAAFAESWNTATHSTALTSQDYLWLTLHIANIGQSHVRGISADLMLLPAISALYPGSEAFVGTAAVVAQSTGQARVTFALLSLAPGDTHTIFIALRPDGLDGPPYEAPVQHQWVAQHRAYWEHFTVTAEQHTKFVQYGFAASLRVRQAASDPAGTSAPQRVPRSAAHSAP